MPKNANFMQAEYLFLENSVFRLTIGNKKA